MYKHKNSELEGELHGIQEQIKENDLQIKKIEQLLNLMEEINVYTLEDLKWDKFYSLNMRLQL
jgi:hypothetical protein